MRAQTPTCYILTWSPPLQKLRFTTLLSCRYRFAEGGTWGLLDPIARLLWDKDYNWYCLHQTRAGDNHISVPTGYHVRKVPTTCALKLIVMDNITELWGWLKGSGLRGDGSTKLPEWNGNVSEGMAYLCAYMCIYIMVWIWLYIHV